MLILGQCPLWFEKLLRVFNRKVISRNVVSTDFLLKTKNYTIQNNNQTLKKLNELNEIWNQLLQVEKLTLAYFKFISKKDLQKFILQRLHRFYDWQIEFAFITQKVSGDEKASLALAAPPEIQESLVKIGFPVNKTLSSIIWKLLCFEYFIKYIKETVIEQIRISKIFLSARFQSHQENNPTIPKVFCFGLTPSEFSKEENELNFVRFIAEKKIPVFQKEAHVFCLKNNQRKNSFHPKENVTVGKNPYFFANIPALRFADFFKQIFLVKINLLKVFIGLLLKKWELFFISKDSLELPKAASWFLRVKPTDIVLSHSEYDSLMMLLGKHFKAQTWRVFYSTNCIPLQYEDQVIQCESPVFTNMFSDHYAVWDNSQKIWLENLGIESSKIHICGPIVFSKYPEKVSTQKSQKKNIALFDVIPMSRPYLLKIGYGETYYNFAFVEQFLNDIYESCLEVFGKDQFVITYKSKRKNVQQQDQQYWEMLKKFSHDKHFRFLSPEISPLFTMDNLDAVISTPYSSPTLIARHYNIPSCFYDVTTRLSLPASSSDGPPLIKGIQELKKWLSKT